jgi:hypothetical protein
VEWVCAMYQPRKKKKHRSTLTVFTGTPVKSANASWAHLIQQDKENHQMTQNEEYSEQMRSVISLFVKVMNFLSLTPAACSNSHHVLSQTLFQSRVPTVERHCLAHTRDRLRWPNTANNRRWLPHEEHHLCNEVKNCC